MDKVLNSLTIAALFHDIGKIYQRSHEKLKDGNEIFGVNRGSYYSHLHAGFTAQFFEKFIGRSGLNPYMFFSKLPFLEGRFNDRETIITVASNHHKPTTSFEWIIAAADRLASGLERTKNTEYQRVGDNHASYITERLISPFSLVDIGRGEKEVVKFPLVPLTPDILPVEKLELSEEEGRSEYDVLINLFERDFEKLLDFKWKNVNNFLLALDTLLEKYLWSVPSASYEVLAYVSLYDHLKITAAFANAVYMFHKNNLDDQENIRNFGSDVEKFILIKGDFSGIQNFIFGKYGQSSKNAAKILRAKSFFVSLFTEYAAIRLVTELGLNVSSIIMNAAGNFVILGANLPDVPEKIFRVRDDINAFLLQKTFGETYFNMAFVTASGRDFLGGRYAHLYDELNRRIGEEKFKHKPRSVVFDGYVERVLESGGTCEYDGVHPVSKEDPHLSDFSLKMKRIGENLVKSKYISISFSEEEKDKDEIELIEGRLFLRFDNSGEITFQISDFEEFYGVAIKDLALYVPKFSGHDVKQKDKYSKDIREEVKEGHIKTFEHIADDAKWYWEDKDSWYGKNFLGVLKADVDNLGKIFVDGLPDNLRVPSVMSCLSRMLNLFFSGWVNWYLRRSNSSIYTVFSGGDDLFLIGPYNAIVDFSKILKERFKSFTRNENFTLSAGIVLSKPKIAMYKLAEFSEEKLEEAKAQPGKDSVNIFGVNVKWKEFLSLLRLKDEIEKWYVDGVVSNSYLYKILKFIEMKKMLDEEDSVITLRTVTNAKWIPLLNYYTFRVIDDRKLAERLLSFYYEGIMRYGEKFKIPVFLVLYKFRKE